ncbi:MAG: septum formation initiator family protein [Oligoflexia bacterium]|nr:septum formation initiator family protein [Oligoflexia bacterium]
MKKIIRIRYALVFILILFVISLSSKDGIIYLFRLKSEIRELKTEIDELTTANNDINKKTESIKKTPRFYEIYARTKLGMIKSDEIVYEVKD